MRNKVSIIAPIYGDGTREDSRAYKSPGKRQEFLYTEKQIRPYLGANKRVLEVGCATGYYAQKFKDSCKEYVGVDIYPPHVAMLQRKIEEQSWSNVSCFIDDAMSLKSQQDESFDVVLCLGPMYHLNEEERKDSFEACKRVCKNNGILIFSYINKLGMYVGSCMENGYIEDYLNEETNRKLLFCETDDKKPGTMFYTTPEKMKQTAENVQLKILKNLAVDFLFLNDKIDQMSEEQFKIFEECLSLMCNSESCTGLANHALLVCQK